MRPIDADDFAKKMYIGEIVNDGIYIDIPSACKMIRDQLDAQPTLDVAPVIHAHWVIVHLTESTPITVRDHCSNCGAPHPYIHGSDECTAHFPPRCPYCDAKMDEEI